MTNLYFILMTGGLAGLAASLVLLIAARITAKRALDEALSEEECRSLVAREIDAIIISFQQQIPMGSTFLRGALLDKLKGSASRQLMALFPRLKERLQQAARARYGRVLILGVVGGVVAGLIAALAVVLVTSAL